jgi:hypothetical protein
MDMLTLSDERLNYCSILLTLAKFISIARLGFTHYVFRFLKLHHQRRDVRIAGQVNDCPRTIAPPIVWTPYVEPLPE